MVILELCDSELLQVQAVSLLHSVWGTRTIVCLNLYDPNRSRLDEACETYRVGQCSFSLTTL